MSLTKEFIQVAKSQIYTRLASTTGYVGRHAAAVSHELGDRFKNAGGLYNYGNLISLGGTLAAAVLEAKGHNVHGAIAIAKDVVTNIVTDPASSAFTVATGVFFWGGEEYHRGFKPCAQGLPPDQKRVGRGHLLSGVGAIALCIGFACLGQPLLAASSGFLHATGKFGSYLKEAKGSFRMAGRAITANLFKDVVLVSRIPAVIGSTLNSLTPVGRVVCAGVLASIVERDLSCSLPLQEAVQQAMMPLSVLVSCGFWAKADLKLLGDSPMNKAVLRPAKRIVLKSLGVAAGS